jgi:hypothetical protein
VSRSSREIALAQAIGADIKSLNSRIGSGGGGGTVAAVPPYTYALRPAAATAGVGALVLITDLVDTKKLQVSDGTRWLSVSDGVVSPNYVASVALNWVSDGDTNGLFYYLGTRDQAGFVIPVPTTVGASVVGSRVSLTALTAASGYSVGHLVDRATTGAGQSDAFSSSNAAGQWVKLDMLDRTFAPTVLSLRHFNEAGTALANFVVEGSSDNAAWTTLLTVAGAANPGAFAWRHWAITGAAAYRYLRVRSTGVTSSGDNFFDVAEMEWYGTLAPGYVQNY